MGFMLPVRMCSLFAENVIVVYFRPSNGSCAYEKNLTDCKIIQVSTGLLCGLPVSGRGGASNLFCLIITL